MISSHESHHFIIIFYLTRKVHNACKCTCMYAFVCVCMYVCVEKTNSFQCFLSTFIKCHLVTKAWNYEPSVCMSALIPTLYCLDGYTFTDILKSMWNAYNICRKCLVSRHTRNRFYVRELKLLPNWRILKSYQGNFFRYN